MKSDFLIAITQLAAERNLSQEIVLRAVEAALVSAFKKDHLADANLAVRFGQAGEIHAYRLHKVVPEVVDANAELTQEDARKIKPNAQIGDTLEQEVTPSNAGRIAAQTAKQVVMQRLREAERDLVYAEYTGKEGQALSGIVQRMEGRAVILDLGRAEALLPPQEQAPTEHYRTAQRLKVYVLEVGKTPKGPQIVVSRTHKDLLRRLFELEVPEIDKGIVEIKAIAREPGFRSKVAVVATQDRVDAVGSCVGLRGMRIQNIVNELHGEKIDVIEWVADPAAFIAKALGPAQVMQVYLRRSETTAVVVVPDRQLSLAIGREGQNARLAAKLTGWRIDIKSATEAETEKDALEATAKAEAKLEAEARTKVRQAVLTATLASAPVRASVAAPPAPAPLSTSVNVPVAAAAQARPAPPPPAPARPAPPPRPVEAPKPAPAWKAPLPPVQNPVLEAVEEVEEEEEAVVAIPLSEALAKEETWQIPTTAKSPIRFAEDIAEFRGRKGGKGRDRDDDRGPKKKNRR